MTTCVEETEPAVEMEEVANCNPSESKDALSPEPQDNPPQKRKKRRKMAHTHRNPFMSTP